MQNVLIDKTALNTLNIELINSIFPNSVVIFALRDPRDVCLSCFMQSFTLSPLTANFLSWTESARFYALIMDYWLSIRDSLSLQWVELCYEDVLNDLEGEFRPIFTKIGLNWSVEGSEFYRHSQRKIIKTPQALIRSLDPCTLLQFIAGEITKNILPKFCLLLNLILRRLAMISCRTLYFKNDFGSIKLPNNICLFGKL